MLGCTYVRRGNGSLNGVHGLCVGGGRLISG